MKDRQLVVLAFVLSRFIAVTLGVRFDAETVETHWQFLDRQLLRTDLLASISVLHAQPPGMNALYGLLAKVSPVDDGYLLSWLLFAGLGLAAALAILELSSRVAGRRIAVILACAFTISPPVLLFENSFFYPHLVMAGLCLAAYALERMLETRRTSWIVAFFAVIAAIALTRSTFHVVWVIAIGLGAIAVVPRECRRVAAIALCAAVLAVGAWYAKNVTVVGKFSASTWFGMSLAKSTRNAIDDTTLERLRREGVITALYLVPPFSPLADYEDYVPLPEAGHPALVAKSKQNGATNYNNAAYVAVSDLYLADAKAVASHEPWSVVEGQIDAWTMYFQPSSQYHHFIRTVFARGGYHGANVDALAPVEDVWNRVVGLQLSSVDTDAELMGYQRREMLARRIATISWSSVLGTLLIFVAVPPLVVRQLRLGGPERRNAIFIAFAWLNIVYVAIICNALEIGENQRFRFETEGLWWLLIALLASTGFRWIAERKRRASVIPGSGASS